jgi:hypothetical protein
MDADSKGDFSREHPFNPRESAFHSFFFAIGSHIEPSPADGRFGEGLDCQRTIVGWAFSPTGVTQR